MFVEIAVVPPAGFKQKDDTKEEIEGLIPGRPATEWFRSFTGPGGQGLYLFAWDGTPRRDRGPMKAVETWKIQADGLDISVSRTSHFFGHAQEVHVAHFAGPKPAGKRYMIYAEGMDRPTFDRVISGISVKK